MASYTPLSTLDPSSHHGGGSSGSLNGPGVTSTTSNSSSSVKIFVMFKNFKREVSMRSSDCTLLELKTEIEKVMDVPVSQQRLVRNGKMLKALQLATKPCGWCLWGSKSIWRRI